MPIALEELKRILNPERAALVLGAGASVPSGAPTGESLAKELWKRVANSEPQSTDLIDTTSFLIHKYSRRPIVEAIISILVPLRPMGGMLGLPALGWRKVFTTNFDLLVEKSYKNNGLPLISIRSNYDFSTKEGERGTRLYKIHGCITQDESLGDKASMLLTEDDYETHQKYRQSLFAELNASLFSDGDVLIIGQSLRDRHLSDLVRQVLDAKQQGAPGAVYVLVYDKDNIKAPILENKGAHIVFGGLDEFVHTMGSNFKPAKAPGIAADIRTGSLPVALVSSTFDAVGQSKLSPNTVKMFNGGPATYADIAAGTTFERAQHSDVVERLTNGDTLVVTLTGAAGVGKTTFARQVLLELSRLGKSVWEHRTDFTFQKEGWIGVEAQMRASGTAGILMLDECTHYLRQTNDLVDSLTKVANPALRLILTANAAQWAPRIKSSGIFSRGTVIELSRLADSEINSMLNLTRNNKNIDDLIHGQFRKLTRAEQFRALRQKCSADMFVCLKNIFANESLDTILLQEFDDLDEPLQDYYRYVAALEAVGTRVHRQLIIRILKANPERVKYILDGLMGIVDEYDIDNNNGIYGWSTRHIVIARRITDYKFSGLKELTELFEAIIENLNPAERVELQTIRAICDQEYGIGRLADSKTRQSLYRKLIEVAPAERIPWHRLIRELLLEGSLDDTEYVIRNAEEAAGSDAPIDRYRVRLLIVRAQKTVGISDGDRTAMLRRAYEMATRNTERHKADKLSYFMLCDVAVELVSRGDSEYLLDEAIERLRIASDRILDPDIHGRIQHYQSARARLR